jgi:hypothetical protein
MSMPITCTAAFQRKDVLFYVLFGANADYIRRLIEESVVNIAREYNTEGIADALQLMRPQPLDSLHHAQIRFFLLLNEDEAMRRHPSLPPVLCGLSSLTLSLAGTYLSSSPPS